MKVVVMDPHYKITNEYDGTFENNTFTYVEGDFKLPILNWHLFGGKKISHEILLAKTVDIGAEHKAYVIYDGKDWKQVYFEGMDKHFKEDRSSQDLVNELEKSELYESSMVPKPFGLREIIGLLLILGLALSIALNYWAIKNLLATYHSETNPFNQSVIIEGQQMHILLNQSLQLHTLYLQCLNKTT